MTDPTLVDGLADCGLAVTRISPSSTRTCPPPAKTACVTGRTEAMLLKALTVRTTRDTGVNVHAPPRHHDTQE